MWLIECPNDDQGLVRPLVTASGDAVLICDSGGEVWLSPEQAINGTAYVPVPPNWQVAAGISIMPGTTRWAEPRDLPEAWGGVKFQG